MTNEMKEPEITEETPVAKPRISIVIVLSVVLGILLAAGGAGVYLYLRQSRVLQSEMLSVKNELKKKSLALDEMKEQVEALSEQMNMLKEYSIARSGAAGEREKNAERAVPIEDVVQGSKPVDDAKGKTVAAEPPVPVAKKAKPTVQNCELVGKSPEEQASTLKRCVGLIDSPPEKPRSHSR